MAPAKSTRKVAKKTRATAKKTARKAAKRTMSAAHKHALAQGRTMSATVDRYLAAVNTPQRRDRKISKGALEERLAKARHELRTANGVTRVLAAQEVRDLQARIAQLNSTVGADLKRLETDFVKLAKQFSEQRGIGYGAWRDAGVPADVLKRAGIAPHARLTIHVTGVNRTWRRYFPSKQVIFTSTTGKRARRCALRLRRHLWQPRRKFYGLTPPTIASTNSLPAPLSCGSTRCRASRYAPRSLLAHRARWEFSRTAAPSSARWRTFWGHGLGPWPTTDQLWGRRQRVAGSPSRSCIPGAQAVVTSA